MIKTSGASKRVLKLSALTVAVGVASGCAQMEQAQKRVDTVREEAIQIRDENVANATSAGVLRTARPRIAGEEIVLRQLNALPPVFARKVTYSTQGAQKLSEVLESLGGTVGVAIRANEVMEQSSASQRPTGPGAPNAAGSFGSVKIEYTGTLRGLLDELAAREDASWRYVARTNTVEFFRYETRTMSVYLPPGAKNITASISLSGVSGDSGGGGGGAAAGSGGGGGSAGNVAVSQNLTIDPWTSIMNGIGAILSAGSETNSRAGGSSSAGRGRAGASGAGSASAQSASGPAGRASANPELGLVTVTARPNAVERVATYIESINARFAQNVMVDIKVYSITMEDQASAGFSLDALYQKLNGYGLQVVGGAPLQPSAGTPSRFVLSSTNPNSRWNGSSLVAQALAQYGNVSLQTQGQVIAINGQPAPIQVANEVNYLASSSTTNTPDVGSTTSLTPGTRVVGFTANFLPLILGDNRILLQYQMQISSLNALTQATSGTATIQTPQISSQSLQQQAFVRDGESIVLFGFDQSRDSIDSALGIASASKVGRTQRQMVVIVMQVNGGRKGA